MTTGPDTMTDDDYATSGLEVQALIVEENAEGLGQVEKRL